MGVISLSEWWCGLRRLWGRWNGTLFKKWSKINETDYLIVSSHGKSIGSSQVTKMLNAIFEKNVSANMIRHSFLTKFYSGVMPDLNSMENLAKAMGHSLNVALTYIKRH